MGTGCEVSDGYGRQGVELLQKARSLQLAALSRRRQADAQASMIYAEALEHFQRAFRALPTSQAARYCGLVSREMGSLEAAAKWFARAHQMNPEDPRIVADYAATLMALNNPALATSLLDFALKLQPTNAALHGELALVLLATGNFARGWDEYEWRLQLPDATTARSLPYSRWQGEPLGDKTLLVTSEQGIGDEIMFASCFEEVIRSAKHCFLEVSTRLAAIFRRSFPTATILERDLQRSPAIDSRLAAPDFWIPAGSIPRLLRRSAEAFPNRERYLLADPRRVNAWRARLSSLGAHKKIGLAWRGGLPGTLRAARSFDLEELRPIVAAGPTFIALEFADCTEEVRQFNSGGKEQIIWWPEAVSELDETAAIAASLDLIISVPTATAHLAAALGTPTWVMIAGATTWRYMNSGERMPWYPTMRLFRGHGNRKSAVIAVERALT